MGRGGDFKERVKRRPGKKTKKQPPPELPKSIKEKVNEKEHNRKRAVKSKKQEELLDEADPFKGLPEDLYKPEKKEHKKNKDDKRQQLFDSGESDGASNDEMFKLKTGNTTMDNVQFDRDGSDSGLVLEEDEFDGGDTEDSDDDEFSLEKEAVEIKKKEKKEKRHSEKERKLHAGDADDYHLPADMEVTSEGIAGCNKTENPNYMDVCGDRKSDKKQEVETSFPVVQSSSITIVAQGSRPCKSYYEILQDDLNRMKETADLAEEYATDMQKNVERAIKRATGAKTTAKIARKTADNREKSRLESPLPGSGTLYHEMLARFLTEMKERADIAEEYAIVTQKNVERAIKRATDARTAAKMARKTADDREKSRLELGNRRCLNFSRDDSEDDREKESRLKLGGGEDTL